MKLNFFFDKHGMIQESSKDRFSILGSYCISEIQRDQRHCMEIMNLARTIKSGQGEVWEGNGNAYTLSLNRNEVCIECDYVDDEIAFFSYDEFLDGLSCWLSFLDQNDLGLQ